MVVFWSDGVLEWWCFGVMVFGVVVKLSTK